MSRARVLVCWPKVPFVRGGTELLVQQLVRHLRAADLDVDTVEIPLQTFPHETAVRHALVWRLMDLQTVEFVDVDLVIATKFPSYFVPHPNKLVWLIHQFRQVYELFDTPFSGYGHARPDDWALARWFVEMDRMALQEARQVWAISANVRRRLQQYLDLDAEVVYPPPPLDGQYTCREYAPAVLIVQRMEPNKRTLLLIESLRYLRGDFQVWLVGQGSEWPKVRDRLQHYGLSPRVRHYPWADETTLIDLYARCRCVVYVPYDEDYGFVPLEAFRSAKPVVTTTDSGGPLEFVRHGETGWVADPDPETIAEGIQTLLDHPDLARRWGEAGRASIAHIHWSSIVHRILHWVHPS